MINTASQFYALAGKYNHVPVIKEILVDCDTPLSIYLKLANCKYSYLLESLQGNEKWGRYSMVGIEADAIIQAKGHKISIKSGANSHKYETGDPLAVIEEFMSKFKVPHTPDLAMFNGGLVGYFSYDTIGYVESKLANFDKADPLDTPDILLMLSNKLAILDNISGVLKLVYYADPNQSGAFEEAIQYLDNLSNKLNQAAPATPHAAKSADKNMYSNIEQAEYLKLVKKMQQYIVQGDMMQAQLSRRISREFNCHPLVLYRALRYLNPSPYMFYLDLDDMHIVGSSPEILVRLQDDEVTIRPLAGTRKRGGSVQEDEALATELLNDPKERAEHLMLIDLGRNDIGRIAQNGTVKVTEQMQIERYSHVMHIVSNVIGKLRPELNAIDVLRASLPAGTLSGAPKIRAMQIIDECETIKRGIYGGAIGYLAFNGNLDTAIAIRTAVIKNKQIYIQVAAGIVADSIPIHEWEETVNKSQALLTAIDVAENMQDLSCY
jgi:anthranilate synthase component I